jgi:hypothetical protein
MYWRYVAGDLNGKGKLSRTMAFRALKSFFPTADELLHHDLPTLGGVLLTHLKSYQGLNTVYQHAGLNRGYFRAMLENRNVGLGPLPKEPEYGTRQPEVTKRMMEAWNWLEGQGLLIHNDEQVGEWFVISSDGEKYLDREKPSVPPSPNPSRVLKSVTGAPRALLSYSWDGPEHQKWVSEFAKRLQGESGVEIIFDQWHLSPGDDKLHFMERAVADSNFVVVVCTPMYAERANERRGGVGYESMVITAELAEQILTNKFIPVLRKGTWTSSLPMYLKNRMGVNLSDEPYREEEYEKLLRVLHGEPIQPPPLARKPDFSSAKKQPTSTTSEETAEEKTRRWNLLEKLRHEYILSHDNLSPALVAGTEKPPNDWVNRRLAKLGEKWILSDLKRPHLTLRFRPNTPTIPLYPDPTPGVMAFAVCVVNDEQRFETIATRLRASLHFKHFSGAERKTTGVWLTPDRQLVEQTSLGMGEMGELLLWFWDVNKTPLARCPVDGMQFATPQTPLELGEWNITIVVTGDNAELRSELTVTLLPAQTMILKPPV